MTFSSFTITNNKSLLTTFTTMRTLSPASYEKRFTREVGHRPIEFVQGIKHDGAFYPREEPLPTLDMRQVLWKAGKMPEMDNPFQLELPGHFDFGRYVWGINGAEWQAIQQVGRLRYEIRFSFAHKDPIPDGTPFVGEVRHADIAKVPRVLVLGYVLDPNGEFKIWNNHMWLFWRMVVCWWANFCHGREVSLWEFLND